MAFYVDMNADKLRSTAAGGITAAYANIGTAFTHPMRIMMAQNLTDALCTFSFDGVNDHFVLPSGGQMILDASSDEFQGNGLMIQKTTQMMVKGTPTTGAVYISAFYARGS